MDDLLKKIVEKLGKMEEEYEKCLIINNFDRSIEYLKEYK